MTRTRLLLGCLLVLAAVAPAPPSPRRGCPSDSRTTRPSAGATTGSRTSTTRPRPAPRSSARPLTGRKSRRRRPTNATNPFDAGYHFEDSTSSLRNAGSRGMTVLMTIWGTPGWANGDQGQNHAPTRMADLQDFSPRARRTLLGALSGLSVRRLLLGLERAEPGAVPRSRVQGRQAVVAARLRPDGAGRLRRDQGGEQQSAGRRSARPRRAVANGRSGPRRHRTRSRRVSSPSSSRPLLGRTSGSTPGPIIRTPGSGRVQPPRSRSRTSTSRSCRSSRRSSISGSSGKGSRSGSPSTASRRSPASRRG